MIQSRAYKIIFLSLTLIHATPVSYSIAQVMQSTGYRMQLDSINIGGGESSSASYSLSDTAGEIGTGYSSGSAYGMHAGFQQVNEGTFIALSSPSDLTLSSVSGLVGGSSEGTIAWQVTTDNGAGYTMSIQSSTSPALASGGDSFADYTPAGNDPDYNFSIGSTESEFGFSPEGTDIVSVYKDNGSVCNTGTSDTQSKCWTSFSTTPKTVMQKLTANHPGGSTNTIRVRAEAGVDRMQPSGIYTAELTVTATML